MRLKVLVVELLSRGWLFVCVKKRQLLLLAKGSAVDPLAIHAPWGTRSIHLGRRLNGGDSHLAPPSGLLPTNDNPLECSDMPLADAKSDVNSPLGVIQLA
ncbi:hypothetical protein CHUAL_010093 [Chamberlinius hualienensis]